MKAIGLPLSLALSGLTSALLALSAGELLGRGGPGGGHRPPEAASGPGCVSFFLGAQRPGETHLHLGNGGPEPITVRVELVDESGNKRTDGTYSLGPLATRDVVMPRPPPDTGIKVSAGSPQLRVRAEVEFYDGSEPEPYPVGRCA
jgi:hypothetical protein